MEGESHDGGKHTHASSGGDQQRLTACLVDKCHTDNGEDQLDKTNEGGAQEFNVRDVVTQSGLEHGRTVVGDGVLATDLVEGGEQQANEERDEQRLLEQIGQLAVLITLDGGLDVCNLTMGLIGATDLFKDGEAFLFTAGLNQETRGFRGEEQCDEEDEPGGSRCRASNANQC